MSLPIPASWLVVLPTSSPLDPHFSSANLKVSVATMVPRLAVLPFLLLLGTTLPSSLPSPSLVLHSPLLLLPLLLTPVHTYKPACVVILEMEQNINQLK